MRTVSLYDTHANPQKAEGHPPILFRAAANPSAVYFRDAWIFGGAAGPAAVRFYLGERRQLLAAFAEIETSRRFTNRPQLHAGVNGWRNRRATPVVAKLDRLARILHFISGPMNGDGEYVAVYVPNTYRVTVNMPVALRGA